MLPTVHTVYSGTVSAGRLYDKIDDYAYGKVMFVTHSSAIVLVLDKEEVEEDDNESKDVIPESNTEKGIGQV